MTTYVWCKERDTWVDKKTREPMIAPEAKANWATELATVAPMVVSDTPEYRSPVTGKPVDGRAARREDLKRSGCVPYEPTSAKPKGIGNPRFAQKKGLKLDEAAFHRERPKRLDPLAALRKP